MELAHRLIVAMRMEEMMSNAIKGMAPSMLDQANMFPGALPEKERVAIAKDVTESMHALMSKMAVLMNEKGPAMYAATFTEAELRDMVAFYESPTGQATLTKMPQLMSQMTPMITQLMPAYQADLLGRLCAREKRYCRLAKPKPAGGAS